MRKRTIENRKVFSFCCSVVLRSTVEQRHNSTDRNNENLLSIHKLYLIYSFSVALFVCMNRFESMFVYSTSWWTHFADILSKYCRILFHERNHIFRFGSFYFRFKYSATIQSYIRISVNRWIDLKELSAFLYCSK